MAGYGVGIEIGGRRRTLRYDLNALATLEEKLGLSISQLDHTTLGVRAIRSLIWAGLVGEEPELTETDVGAWIGPGALAITTAMTKVGEALKEALGGENPTVATAEMPEPAIGIGRTSSGSGLEN
jgi:hypothetical protein